MVPLVTILPDSLTAAGKAGLCSTAQTRDGALRLFAASVPESELHASVTLLGAAYSLDGDTASDEDIVGIISGLYGEGAGDDGESEPDGDDGQIVDGDTASDEDIANIINNLYR